MLNDENAIKKCYNTVLINFAHSIRGSYRTVLESYDKIQHDIILDLNLV